MIHLTT